MTFRLPNAQFSGAQFSDAQFSDARLRFAPSPTGHLHRGHAYSAFLNKEAAQIMGGTALLRIEDIDFTRCKESLTTDLLEDMAWLDYPDTRPVKRQSENRQAYLSAKEGLEKAGYAYPCFCTRSNIKMVEGRYASTCKSLTAADIATLKAQGTPFALRLDMAKAAAHQEAGVILHSHGPLDDCIIARKDIGLSYHIAVVVDDAKEGITHIIRGQDLKAETPYHLVLQKLLGLPTPRYFHHSLLLDKTGDKLAKSKGSQSLRDQRAEGLTPEDLATALRTFAQESGDWQRLMDWVHQP